MKRFEYDSIEDLIFNKSFRNWVLYKQSDDAAFWEDFTLHNPEKSKLINDSKAIIYALQINFKGLTDEDINVEIRKVLYKSKNQLLIKEGSLNWQGFFHSLYPRPFFIALSVLLLVLASIALYYNIHPKQNFEGYDAIVERETKGATFYRNNSDTIKVFLLPDNSRVSLSPHGTLSVANNFQNTDRKVYLSGEAFFEVSKNAAKPFFVFTNTIVTKVLGTSFRVKAYANKISVVTVRTGKVSVIKASHFNEKYAKSGELGGVLITPNQEVTYVPENNDLNKSVTEQPVLVAEPGNAAFAFDGTPIKKVFEAMQQAYGVPILFDDKILSSCSLSANMGSEPFYDKLDIICKAINATYEKIDGNIVVTSNGCK